MRIVPLTIEQAEGYLASFDRHYKAPSIPICALGLEDDTKSLHGAAILGMRDGKVAELAHIYADGTSQAYTLLYGASWRVLKAMGFEYIVP